MTILDSFYLLFESDAAKLDKGLTESERKAKKLAKEVTSVDDAAKKLGDALNKSAVDIGKNIVGLLAIRQLVTAFFDAAEGADKLNESTERLGLNIETISAWGDLVKKNGGSVDGFVGSIEGLNYHLAQMEATGKSRAAPFLKELGIDLEDAANKGRSAMDFLPQIAEAFAGMDKQKSAALGRRLGFDQATIMTLQAGRREVEALLEKEKELGVVTKKQGEIADAFGDQMDDTRHAFRSVWLGIMEHVLPPLTWMMGKFQDVATFMRKHSDFVVGLMIAIGAAITFYALPPLVSMAAAVVVAFAPFILAGVLVAALATAFALLYDDILNFIDGGDSMIGQILTRWPIIGETIRSIVGAFGDLWNAAKTVGDLLMWIWDNPQKAFAAYVNFVLAGLRALVSAIPGLSTALDALGIDLSAGNSALAQASGTGLASQTSNSISNVRGGRSTNVQVGTVEVHTQATDAQGISKAIGGTMQTQMRQAVNNYDDGVLA